MSSTNHTSIPSHSTIFTTGSKESDFFSETNSERSSTFRVARLIDEKEAHRQHICRKFEASVSWLWLVENADLIIERIEKKLHSGGVAIITEFSENKVHFFAQHGYGKKRSLKRQVALANQVFACEGEGYVVEDASKDRKCKGNPYVTGFPHIRFYCCTPLKTPCGQIFGALEIYDTVACYETSEFERILLQVANQIQNSLRPIGSKQIHQQEPENPTSCLPQLSDPTSWPSTPCHMQAGLEPVLDPCASSQMKRGGNFFSSKIYAAPKSRPPTNSASQDRPESSEQDTLSFRGHESHNSAASSTSYKHHDPSADEPSWDSEPEDPDATLRPRDRPKDIRHSIESDDPDVTIRPRDQPKDVRHSIESEDPDVPIRSRDLPKHVRYSIESDDPDETNRPLDRRPQPKDMPWSIESDDADETMGLRDRSPQPEDFLWDPESNELVAYSKGQDTDMAVMLRGRNPHEKQISRTRNPTNGKIDVEREMINNFILTRRQRLNRTTDRGIDWKPTTDAHREEERSWAEEAFAVWKDEKIWSSKQGLIGKFIEDQSSKVLANESPRRGRPGGTHSRSMQNIRHGDGTEEEQRIQLQQFRYPQPTQESMQIQLRDKSQHSMGPPARQGQSSRQHEHSTRSSHGSNRGLEIHHSQLSSIDGLRLGRHEHQVGEPVPHKASHSHHASVSSLEPDRVPQGSHPSQTAPLHQSEFAAPAMASTGQHSSRPSSDNTRSHYTHHSRQTAPMHQEEFKAPVKSSFTQHARRSDPDNDHLPRGVNRSQTTPISPNPDNDRSAHGVNRSQTAPMHQEEFKAPVKSSSRHHSGRPDPDIDRPPRGGNRGRTTPIHQGEFTASIPDNSSNDHGKSHPKSKQSQVVPGMYRPSQTAPLHQGEFTASGRIMSPGHRPGRSNPVFDRVTPSFFTPISHGDSQNERPSGVVPSQGPRRTTIATQQEAPGSFLPTARRLSNAFRTLVSTNPSSPKVHRKQKESTSKVPPMKQDSLPNCPESEAMAKNLITMLLKSGPDMEEVLMDGAGQLYEWKISADGTKYELREQESVKPKTTSDDYSDSLVPPEGDGRTAPLRLPNKLQKKPFFGRGSKADKKAAEKEKALALERENEFLKKNLQHVEGERGRLETMVKGRDKATRLMRTTTNGSTPDLSEQQHEFPDPDSPKRKSKASSGCPPTPP